MSLFPSSPAFGGRLRAGLVGLALLLPLSPPAAAGNDAESWPIFSAEIFRQSAIQVPAAILRGMQPASQAGSRLPQDALRFMRQRHVELAARERLLESVLATTDDPEVRERLRASVASDRIWRKFDRILEFVGYSGRNLADVTTAYYVIAWEVVSGGQAVDHLDGVRLVRNAVADALLHDSRVAAMTDADKQESAVVMSYMAIVAAHRARELRDSGNQAALARLREAVRLSVLEGQGVDLGTLRLSSLGFVPD